MSKRLLLQFECESKLFPPIIIDIAIPNDLASVIEKYPITSTIIKVTDSMFFSPTAQKEELKGELNRFIIL